MNQNQNDQYNNINNNNNNNNNLPTDNILNNIMSINTNYLTNENIIAQPEVNTTETEMIQEKKNGLKEENNDYFNNSMFKNRKEVKFGKKCHVETFVKLVEYFMQIGVVTRTMTNFTSAFFQILEHVFSSHLQKDDYNKIFNKLPNELNFISYQNDDNQNNNNNNTTIVSENNSCSSNLPIEEEQVHQNQSINMNLLKKRKYDEIDGIEGGNMFDQNKKMKLNVSPILINSSSLSNNNNDVEFQRYYPNYIGMMDNNTDEELNTSVTINTNNQDSNSLHQVLSTSTDNPHDKLYFDSYGSFEMHEIMLKDKTRTESYRRAILDNKELFKDKVVLDVGCGTSILSLFATQAGAKIVYGVEGSSEIAQVAKEIIRSNNLENRICVITGKIEEITLPVSQVDIIISEWMGHALVYENMLESVLYARDRYLKPNGHMFPSRANLYICPINEQESFETHKETITSLDNVYGFDYSVIKGTITQSLFEKPEIKQVFPEQVLSLESSLFHTIDILNVNINEIREITGYFTSTSTVSGIFNGFCIWFDVVFDIFDNNQNCINHIFLSTDPNENPTHWQQCAILLNNEIIVKQDDKIEGIITLSNNTNNKRFIDFDLSLTSPKNIRQKFYLKY